MRGILKSFKAKLKTDGTHDEYNKIYKFVVVIEIKGVDTTGEAGSKSTSGSKSWIIGKEHEFEKNENSYAEGGYYFKGLKVIELVPNDSNPIASHSFDIMKESYVISRFSHTFALERLLSLPEADRKKLKEDHGYEIISKLATSIAKSIYERAIEVQLMHEARNAKTS